VMAGGYAETINDTVDIHYQSVRTALSRAGSHVEGHVGGRAAARAAIPGP